jgi:hypothetical protein
MKKNHVSRIVKSGWQSSQALLDVLLAHRFVQVQEMGLLDQRALLGRYQVGTVYHFRKYGDCRIGFLKDGRLHVLNGPMSQWELFDSLSDHELRVLLAFCSLHEEHQMFFRKNMGTIKSYALVPDNLPPFDAEWKRAFMEQYDRLGDLAGAA